jgi:hypothetical protein
MRLEHQQLALARQGLAGLARTRAFGRRSPVLPPGRRRGGSKGQARGSAGAAAADSAEDGAQAPGIRANAHAPARGAIFLAA